MKKLIAVLLTAGLLLSLCACGGKQKRKASATGPDLTWEEIERLADEALEKEAEAAEQ